MKRLALVLSLLLLFAAAAAQQRHNYLAVNGAVLDDAGPYYFIAQGDSGNAFAKASQLAGAMGLNVEYLATERRLVFKDGTHTVAFDITSDIAAGLVKRDGVVSISPPLRGVSSLASPMAILVDGTAYVAISPLVTAFDGVSDWHAASRLVTVDTADKLGFSLAAPRTGLTNGVSRVAIDLPAGAAYEVAVGNGTLYVAVPGARAQDFVRNLDDPNLRSVRLAPLSGAARLIVEASYTLDAAGRGFTVGTVPKADGFTLYVDFAPTLVGAAVLALETATDPVNLTGATEPQALAAVPELRRVVVLDAGHGDHDPGGNSVHAVEKHVVLSVTLKLKALLEAEGIDVVLTRDRDIFLTLQQRSEFATPERNLFVSVHANSVDNVRAEGIETWVFGEPLDPTLVDRAIRENGGGAEGAALTEAARRAATDLATDILREAQLNYSLSLAETVQRHMVEATGARDRGIRTNLFYVLRTARIPAILVELGFVTNAEEGAKLATDSYQNTLAQAIADGIMEFLDNGGGTLARR